MRHSDHGAFDVRIAYVGGGSRAWAWTLMADLAMEGRMGGELRLYDIDREAALQNGRIGEALSARKDAPGKWRYRAARSLADALDGADFVVVSILPGTFDEMASDVHLPERHGIFQSVGDTAGPGGVVRALRTLPMLAEIAEAVREYAPGAWVVNYTNPMSLCVRALYRAFPGIKAFGCCHEVFGTQSVLRGIAGSSLGLEIGSREDIEVDVLGLNHFTWFDRASYEGVDLFPVYADYVHAHYDSGYEDPGKAWDASYFNCAHRVKFDLFRRYGLIAAAGDRHLAEFMPGGEYLSNPETVRSWKFSLTPVSWRKADLVERRARASRLASGAETMELKSSGEEGVGLLKALCGLGRTVSNVNLPNSLGQIADFPRSTVVETNALFERDAVRPIPASSVPADLLPLFDPHLLNQEDVLEAAFAVDYGLALRAFMRDPLVAGRVTPGEGDLLLKDMIRNTLAYLPEGWKSLV
jgi:galacturan 1,4-alpha-galacturonidase